MKVFFKILFVFIFISNGFSQESSTNNKKPEIMFEKTIHNFGKIKANEDVIYKFEFKNIGKTPLIIQRLETSCGCAIANKPEYPIKPKEKAYITVLYDGSDEGNFAKSIKVFSNAEMSPVTVYIKGIVVKE
jgi:hypothetical protein